MTSSAPADAAAVQQMDVSTAFVNADLDRDDPYFELPPGGVPSVPDVNSSKARKKS